jgi:hypothetical protein
VTTPAEVLLNRLRRQCRLDGFRVSLAQRCGDLYLHQNARHLPDPATVVAFMTGGCCDLVHVYVGDELAQTHQLVDNKRRWRTTTIAQADEEADDGSNPPATPVLQERPAPAGATP